MPRVTYYRGACYQGSTVVPHAIGNCKIITKLKNITLISLWNYFLQSENILPGIIL